MTRTLCQVVNQTIECLENPAQDNVGTTERTVSTTLLRGLSAVNFARVLGVLMTSLSRTCRCGQWGLALGAAQKAEGCRDVVYVSCLACVMMQSCVDVPTPSMR